MSKKFVVVHEAPADFETATELADRALLEAIRWLDGDILDSQREWRHEAPTGRRLTWASVKRLASEAGIKVHGHFDGRPGLADARAARRAIAYVRLVVEDAIAILLIRDAVCVTPLQLRPVASTIH